jgi:hypothetical protein
MLRKFQRTKLVPWCDTSNIAMCYHAHITETNALCYHTMYYCEPCNTYLLESNITDRDNLHKYGDNVYTCVNPACLYLLNNSDRSNNICVLIYCRTKLNNCSFDILSFIPNAIEILRKNIRRVSWDHLSSNEAAIDLLENNIDKININRLLRNKGAAHLIKRLIRERKIDTNAPLEDIQNILRNPCAIRLLEKYFWRKKPIDKYYYTVILSNRSVCY